MDVQASDMGQGEKNLRYLQLMIELEKGYGAMIVNPTEEDLPFRSAESSDRQKHTDQ